MSNDIGDANKMVENPPPSPGAGSALTATAQRLREYLESSACVLPGFDIPDDIWIPFTEAIDSSNAELRHGEKETHE